MATTRTISVPAQQTEEEHGSSRPQPRPALALTPTLALTLALHTTQADITEKHPTMPPVYKEITYDTITGTSINENHRRILCPNCMNSGFYRIIGGVQINEDGKHTLIGPGPEGTATIELRQQGAAGQFHGQFPPKSRTGITDEEAELMLDLHITSPEAACMQHSATAVMDLQIKLARSRIRKKSPTGEEEKRKYFANTKQRFPRFDVGMTPEELETNLATATSIAADARWRWTQPLQVEVLSKELTKELRQKIKEDTNKNAWEKEDWSYEELAAAIRRHAAPKPSTMHLAKDPPITMKDVNNMNTEETSDLDEEGVQRDKPTAHNTQRFLEIIREFIRETIKQKDHEPNHKRDLLSIFEAISDHENEQGWTRALQEDEERLKRQDKKKEERKERYHFSHFLLPFLCEDNEEDDENKGDGARKL